MCRFSATKPGMWLAEKVAWKLDPVLLKLTRGRFSTGGPLPSALLETTGARSGRPRRNATLYFHDGERVTIIASKQGRPENPAWFYNLCAHPDVVLGGQSFRAEVVEDETERQRLWELADRVFPPFAKYREWTAKTGRVIPIVQLTPR
jgi:deazaflavin-dependent oxidoreductase (nitroreductase family)